MSKPKKIAIAILGAIYFSANIANSVTILSSYQNANTTPSQTQEVKEEVEDDSKCIRVLEELKINNNCAEVKKIVKAFNSDRKIVAGLLHESNFDRLAVGKNKDGSIDRGVFQINNVTWSYQNRNKNAGLYYKQGDIDNSILIAKRCYQISGYGCWYAITNGSYKKHLDRADKLIESLN